MINIGFCDSNDDFLKRMERNVEQQFSENGVECRRTAFKNGQELLRFLDVAKDKLHMVFVDVELPDMDGIQLAKRVYEYYPTCKIVFVAKDLAYATEVYNVKHCYFILKSEFEKRLPDLFEMIMTDWQERPLVVSYNGKTKLFTNKEIAYIERGRQSGTIVTKTGREHVSTNFLDMCEQLDSPVFVRCHNSYIVNLNEARSLDKTKIVMKNGDSIPVSRSYKQLTQQAFEKWIQLWR